MSALTRRFLSVILSAAIACQGFPAPAIAEAAGAAAQGEEGQAAEAAADDVPDQGVEPGPGAPEDDPAPARDEEADSDEAGDEGSDSEAEANPDAGPDPGAEADPSDVPDDESDPDASPDPEEEAEPSDVDDAEGSDPEAEADPADVPDGDAGPGTGPDPEDALAPQADALYSDTWGKCSWEISSDGVLTVHPGEGASQAGKIISPWYSYRDSITSVIFAEEDGRKVIAPANSQILLCWLANVVSVDASGLDTSNVTNMGEMFANCSSLETLNLSGWDTSKVIDMYSVFANCSSLETLNLSGWDTSGVRAICNMFADCSSLETLYLSGWDTSNVEDMEGMFSGCPKLETVYVGSGWSTERVIRSDEMFSGCTSIVGGNGTAYDPNYTDKDYARIDLPGARGYLTFIMSGRWGTCPWVITADGVLTVRPGEGASQEGMFSSPWESYRDSITSVVFAGEGGRKVIAPADSYAMFDNCSSIETFDLSGLDTSNVTSMRGMFRDCSSLTSLNLSGWNTSRVEDMGYMFASCSSLETLNLSGWDTSGVEDMDAMFAGCSSLETVLVGDSWSTERVETSDGMFSDCTSIVGANGTAYDPHYIDKAYARIDLPGAPGYLSLGPVDISDAEVTVADQTYTGSAIELAVTDVTVVVNGETVDSGAYTVSCGSNVNAGTATVTVTAKDGSGYRGTASGTFTIARAEVAVPTAKAGLVYDGSAQTGVAAGNGYALAGTAKATNAGSYTATATPDDNHRWPDGSTGGKAIPWSIAPRPVSGATVTLSTTSYTYSGAARRPSVTSVVVDGRTLTAGTDYTVGYKDNTAAGTATATVTGKGNYGGSKSVAFTIKPRPINASGVIVSSISSRTYTGSAIKPALTVKDGTETLKSGTDYALSYKSNVNAGTATVTVTGRGNYTGTKSVTFEIVAKPISGATVAAIADKAYTGSAIKPTPAAKVGSRTLKAGTDYTRSYRNNTKVGTATLTITGRGNYAGTKSVTFKVVRASIAKATVAAIADKTYTGSAIKPTPTVKVGSRTLKAGTDYTLSYANNTNVGTATVTITGRGNYKGTKSVTFKVAAAPISKATVAKVADQAYTGKPITPSPKVAFGGRTLKAGTDYALSYANNTKAGTATINITGRGNFKGTKKATFRIVAPAMREFPDVPKDHWAHDAIGRAAALGVINGYADGTYGPSDRITRAQIAVMLWNMSGRPEPGAGARRFSDVTDPKAYYYKAVTWAGEVGIVNGYPDGSFGPGDDITREQLCVMAANYATKVGKRRASGSESDYASMPDASSVAPYARPAVGWAYREGVLPVRTGRLDPQAKADRAQAAWVVMGTYDFLR